ncbi:MAG: MASE1 domain-containing protein, partial [Opitutaceae bacterium]|nr:MASE1 domain-containing protein [Opitutaceae bacterium]
MISRPHRPLIACVAYTLLHIGLQVVAQNFEVAPGLSVWYPPAGLALGLLILLGPRFAPLIFVVNALVAIPTTRSGALWAPLLFPFLITAYYTGLAWWIRRVHGPRLLPGSFRQTLTFTAAVILGPAGMALVGSGAAVLTGLTPASGMGWATVLWWVGDSSGLLTVLPPILVFAAPWLGVAGPSERHQVRRANIASAGFLFACVALILSLALVFTLDSSFHFQALSLCFLPLIWICLRHGLPGATLATLFVTMAGLAGLHFTPGTREQIVGFLFFELTFTGVG